MKTKIIPAINAQTFEEIKEKINLLKDLTNHFHLDVASLEFTGYQTWQNPEDLNRLNYPNKEPNNIPEYKPNENQKFGPNSDSEFGIDSGNDIKFGHDSGNTFGRYSGKKSVVFDLHLMLSLKPQEILKWAKENVKTLILHLEASQNPDGLIKMAKKTKKKIFIAWSPDVEFDFIKKYLNYVDGVLILGVRPGRAGQKFLEETYERIEMIKFYPNINRIIYPNEGPNNNIYPNNRPNNIPEYKPNGNYPNDNRIEYPNDNRIFGPNSGNEFGPNSGNEFGNNSGNEFGQNSGNLGLRRSASLKLMIDGGVNEENFQKILSYEPDFIVMASAIYNSENPKEKYLWFLNQIKN